MALFHTSPYHPWMLYKTLQVGYCLWTATSEAAISFSWVPSTFPLEFKSLFKKNVGYFWPATFYPPPAKIYARHATRTVSILTLFLASLSSLFLPRHQHLPDVAGQPGLIPTDTLSSSFVLGSDRPTFLSSFVATFKKRCLYSFIGICGTWIHRFAFWKFYLKPGLITSFRSALRSVRMDVWKYWSLSGLITFSMLAESLRSFDLSRKIEGDSVRRVIDQILGSYFLSCVAFSVYEVVFTFLVGCNQSKYATDKLREWLHKSHAGEKPLCTGYRCLALPSSCR